MTFIFSGAKVANSYKRVFGQLAKWLVFVLLVTELRKEFWLIRVFQIIERKQEGVFSLPHFIV